MLLGGRGSGSTGMNAAERRWAWPALRECWLPDPLCGELHRAHADCRHVSSGSRHAVSKGEERFCRRTASPRGGVHLDDPAEMVGITGNTPTLAVAQMCLPVCLCTARRQR